MKPKIHAFYELYHSCRLKNITFQTASLGSSDTQATAAYTDICTETAEAASGRLQNVFDKEKVQQELDLQREVSQQFSQNVQEANTEINKHIDELERKKEAGTISDTDYQKELGKLQYLKTGLNMVAAGLSAPTDSVAGIAAATVSPAIAYEIGQHFKGLAKDNADGKLTAKQEAAHILSHAVLGAAVAAVGGNDAMTAAVAAGGAEAVAPVVSNWLYGEEDASKLTAEQKETVASIAGLAGTAVGVAMGDAADVAQGSQAAINAVENNYLLKQDWDNYKSKVNSCSQNQNAAACYREAQKELYVISRQRNKRLKSACAENGDIALCEKYVAEADLSRDLTKRELASYGTNNPAKPLPSFVEYYDIPWSDNPSIHYWSTKINLPISDKLNYGLNLAVNRVTGEIFLGVSGEPNIKSSGAKKLLGAPSVSIIAGHINNLSPIEKARLWETITNTLQGQSTTIAGCGYFSCVGANKTPSGKVSFEFGISTSGTTSGAVGKANMIKIGRIIGDD